MLYITEEVTVDDFLLNFARGKSVISVQAIISHHTGTPLALVPLFHGGNVPVKSLSVYIAHLPHDFLGISQSESLRNTLPQTYYTA